MYEQWHPLGPVGIISAFNFPVAVWSWNSFIAAVCGDTCIWKPSSEVPLSAVAVTEISRRVMDGSGFEGVFNLVAGSGSEVGEALINDGRIPLVSATGSNTMGERVAVAVAKRFGRSILELGGNNAVIVMDDADLDLAERAVPRRAAGTAGQRCTTLRRLIAHKDISDEMVSRLVKAYEQVPIGDPLDAGVLMGPLINQAAVDDDEGARCRPRPGGEIITVETGSTDRVLRRADHRPYQSDAPIVQEETFAPILYVIDVDDLEEAIAVQNGVPRVSSAIFTESMRHAETFLSHLGSDCGIANVNIGTSGAEIGGAFGARKPPEAGARRGQTRGRRTCAAKPRPSTGVATCLSPKVSSLG